MAKNGQLEVSTNGAYTTEIAIFGGSRTLSVTNEEVRQLVAIPTKSGKLPTDREIGTFLRLCQARGLDPFAKDVFLLGYDTKDGAKFEGVVSLQAMLKRAEANPDYRGKEYGVLVWDKDKKELQEIQGDAIPSTAAVVGGWCRVYRENRRPEYATATTKAYNKGFGHWNIDPNWMIAKCAIAKALRQAFPGDLGDMFSREEVTLEEVQTEKPKRNRASVESRLNQRVLAPPSAPVLSPSVPEVEDEISDAWEPDEEERAAIEGQLFDSHDQSGT